LCKLGITADIHAPKYFAKFREEFLRVVKSFELDHVILVGDITDRGNIAGLRLVEELVGGYSAYAVPGNEEYDSLLEELKRSRIRFLFDEVIPLSSNPRVFAVGSRGCLARPTRWQREHVPGIDRVYEERRAKLVELISKCLGVADVVLVLTHYATSRATLRGEDPRIWPMLGIELAEELNDRRILYVHGHAHNSKVRCAYVGSSLVLNVSFPNLWRIFIVELERGVRVLYPEVECAGGLMRFLG